MTQSGFKPYIPKNSLISKEFFEQIPENDRIYLDDTFTVSSYVKTVELMDQLLKEGIHSSPLEKVTDPQFFIVPKTSHKLNDSKLTDSLFDDYLSKIPKSSRVSIEGDHFSMVLPSTKEY